MVIHYAKIDSSIRLSKLLNQEPVA